MLSEKDKIKNTKKKFLQNLPETISSAPLTDSQRSIYFAYLQNPRSTMHSMPLCIAFRKNPQMHMEILKNAVNIALQNHPALFCRIENMHDIPHMVSTKPYAACEVLPCQEKHMAKLKQDFLQAFDLAKAPLFRAKLAETPDNIYLLFDAHHIIFDGTSFSLLCKEIAAILQGKKIEPEQIHPFTLHLVEERIRQSPIYEMSQKYFESLFAGIEVDSNLAPDKKAPDTLSARPCKLYERTLGEELNSKKIQDFIAARHITENTFFIAAFAYALAQMTGQKESLFCTGTHGRYDASLANCVGMLVKIIPVHMQFHDTLSIQQLLQQTQNDFYATLTHSHYSFEDLIQQYNLTTDILFAYQGNLLDGVHYGENIAPVEVINLQEAICNINFMVFKKGHHYQVQLRYRSDLYAKYNIESFINTFINILHGFIDKEFLKDIPLINTHEIEILNKFNNTSDDYDKDKTILHLFAEQVKERPHNTAVVYKKVRVSYAELDAITDKIAQYITTQGLQAGDFVSILIGRNEFMPISALGVLKAGMAYQPLDPSYPVDRLEFMMQDAQIKLLIADEDFLHLVPEYQGAVLKTCDIFALKNDTLNLAKPEPHNIFALLYTSGSTGKPKGCMLLHENIYAFVIAQLHMTHMNAKSASAAFASFGFDANFMDMYPILCAGGELHIIAEDIRLNLDILKQYYIEHSISHSFMTTQVGRQFIPHLSTIPSLQWFGTGGEALLPIEPQKGVSFVNIYGPTECTVYATHFKVDKLYDPIPIGKPIKNIKLYIIDSHKRLLPRGAIGELCIAGPQVSLGYLGRAEASAKVFTKNPFCHEKGYERLYHTGDLVRMWEDGNIEFIGRRDLQVKIRGFRIELTEIEGIITEYPGISAATVIAKDLPGGNKGLFAYIVAKEHIDIESLNHFILEKKPPYMVPSATLQIKSIPLTPNQKVDKKKLPDIPLAQTQTKNVRNTLTKLECELIEIVHEILNVTVDISTSLRMAGLSSIDAIKLATELNKRYGFSPHVQTLLKDCTVLKLEDALIEHLLQQSFTPQNSLKPTFEKAPLSQTQLGIYLASLNDLSAYTIPLLLKLPKSISISKLKTALQASIQAHPSMLCTVKPDEHGHPFMYPRPELAYDIPIIPWQEDHMPELTNFSFDDSALFCIRLFESPAHTYLLFEAHHIIADGESVSIFLSDLNKAYAGENLTQEAYTIFDITFDEQKERQTAKYIEAKNYYTSILQGVSVNVLPDGDVFGKKSILKKSTRTLSHVLPDIITYCQKHALTENAFFTASFAFLLAQFSAQDAALFNVIYNGRNNPKAFTTFAMLVKTLPLYCNIALDMSPHTFVSTIEQSLQKLREYDIYSYAEASHAYGIKNDILFAYQGGMLQNLNLSGHALEIIEIEAKSIKAPINVDVFAQQHDIKIHMEYDGALYTEAFIQSFLEAYEACIINFLSAATLGEVSLLDAINQNKNENALKSLHDTDWPVPYRPAYRLLQDSALQYPENTALIAHGERLSYRQLNSYANKLGHALCDLGIKINSIVALMLERNAYVYVARQGILKSGGAFLSIDPNYPDDRVDFIIQDSGAKVLILTKDIYTKRQKFIDALGIKLCFIDHVEHWNHVSEADLQVPVPAEALAYCIYTSGSTGKPKGVMLTQKNLVNFVDNNPKNHETLGYIEKGKVSLALASITFDVSIMEEFIPLAHGLSICMANTDEIHNPLALRKLCLENHVDIMSCTPSFLLNFMDIQEVQDVITALKSIDLGAEIFPPALYTKLRELNPNLYIMNGYGPTETTISCTMSVVNTAENITIGTPNANTKVLVVDSNNNILPMGALGEMVILGHGVGKGYINRQDLTEQAFIHFWGTPAYKSGDFARILPNGEIEYRGRRDNQVKLRGLRVELNEIEATINSFEGVKSSLVLVKSSPSGQYLVAYYTAHKHISSENLTAYLASTLTEYMVPSQCIQIDAFPLTANNKIDKSKLPDSDYQAQTQEYMAPSNALEKDFCDFFARILNLTKVGASDNFFELGGTSLNASKLAVMAMAKNYPIVYADIFKSPTPQDLAKICTGKNLAASTDTKNASPSHTHALQHNTMAYVDDIKEYPMGNLLLTGATGFLGIHILKSFLDHEEGKVYCLMRKGNSPTLEKRLASLLMYYFDEPMTELASKRIVCIEGDITDPQAMLKLSNTHFDTLINCAAIVKHFAHDDSLEKTNVQGVKNLIAFCKQEQKRLIHISTISIAGEGIDNYPPLYKQLHEHELVLGQVLDNAYIKSKFDAEKAMLQAIEEGLDGKIMRVGNLMSRTNDGEFQINSRTNGFMSQLKAYKILGKYPVNLMALPAEFSPIDTSAHAILTLSKTHKRYTVFHPYNSHCIYMSDVIAAMKRHGFQIDIVSDTEFQQELKRALNDPKRSEGIAGLLTYLDHSATQKHLIDGNNQFTTEALYRLGFLWPITDMQYLERTFALLDDFSFFE